MINFYADWCRFSNMLSPIWDEAAEKMEAEFGKDSKIVVGKIDCDKESESIFERTEIQARVHALEDTGYRCVEWILDQKR